MSPIVFLSLQLLAVPVGTVRLAEVAFSPSQDAPAQVLARNESRLSAEIVAVIREVRVEVGDRTQRGQTLVALDCRAHGIEESRAAADLAALEAEAGLAERQLERARRLRESQTVSEELLDARGGERDALVARVRAALAHLERARLDVERCTVRAPFSGIVTTRAAQVGELTTPGAPLITLLETEGLQVVARLGLESARSLEQAEDLRFTWQDGEVAVSLLHLLPVVDRDSRSREARLLPLGEAAFPGTAGRLTWRVKGRAVPAHLLVRREGRLGLFVVEVGAEGESESGGTARARFHALDGAEEGRPALVDLPDGTLIVTEGRLSLRDGDEVSSRDGDEVGLR